MEPDEKRLKKVDPSEFDDLNEALSFDLDPLQDIESETRRLISTRKLRSDLKHQTLDARKRQELAAVMPALPAPGECYHIVSNGHFDYWTWIPVMVGYLGRADEYYGSTWTMNRHNVVDLLDMIERGLICQAAVVTGDYLKHREPAVYATLLRGFRRRSMRVAAAMNHTKVTLLANHERGDYLVLEGSANYTSNPRMEQNIILNDQAVYRFHRDWLEEVLAHGDEED